VKRRGRGLWLGKPRPHLAQIALYMRKSSQAAVERFRSGCVWLGKTSRAWKCNWSIEVIFLWAGRTSLMTRAQSCLRNFRCNEQPTWVTCCDLSQPSALLARIFSLVLPWISSGNTVVASFHRKISADCERYYRCLKPLPARGYEYRYWQNRQNIKCLRDTMNYSTRCGAMATINVRRSGSVFGRGTEAIMDPMMVRASDLSRANR